MRSFCADKICGARRATSRTWARYAVGKRGGHYSCGQACSVSASGSLRLGTQGTADTQELKLLLPVRIAGRFGGLFISLRISFRTFRQKRLSHGVHTPIVTFEMKLIRFLFHQALVIFIFLCICSGELARHLAARCLTVVLALQRLTAGILRALSRSHAALRRYSSSPVLGSPGASGSPLATGSARPRPGAFNSY
jgi:hypothetical protein